MEDQLADVIPVPQPKRTSRLFGQYIIKHRFQFKFSFFIFVFLAVACFTMWLMGEMALNRMVLLGYIEKPEALEQVQLLNSMLRNVGILAVFVTFALSLFFSHLVAGPIYRFEKTFEAMRDGDLSMFIKLRKRDEFKETAELFNQALASLRVKVQKERDAVASKLVKLGGLAATLRSAGRTIEADELERMLGEIRNTPPQIKI